MFDDGDSVLLTFLSSSGLGLKFFDEAESFIVYIALVFGLLHDLSVHFNVSNFLRLSKDLLLESIMRTFMVTDLINMKL